VAIAVKSAKIVTLLEFVIGLLGSSALVGLGCYQLHLRRTVQKLERQGKLTPEDAIRIRKKPMALIGWALILSGTILFALQAFKAISN
jgi:hypothetical protein